MTTGILSKLKTKLENIVQYHLPLGNELIPLNQYIEKKISFSFTKNIFCIHCNIKIKKAFNQGYCFPCTQKLAACDICIVKPELCHYDKGTCREPEWAQSHCMQKHYIYLSNTSGVKVGITRHTQIPTRWIDQGATEALIIGEVDNRLFSGLVEKEFKDFVADKTDWRKMLKGNNTDDINLKEKRDELLMNWPEQVAGQPLLEEELVKINYPVATYPEKVKSINLDKSPEVEGTLQGVKGQYLILDTGVINMRKYQGYELTWNHS